MKECATVQVCSTISTGINTCLYLQRLHKTRRMLLISDVAGGPPRPSNMTVHFLSLSAGTLAALKLLLAVAPGY